MSKSCKFLPAIFSAFVVLNIVGSFYTSANAQSLPTEVLSPVIGPLRVTKDNLGKRDDKWEFSQHKGGYHRKNGGVSGSDDTYAWDANLYMASNKNADAGKEVYAVAEGDIVKYGGGTFPGSCNAVLVAHPNKQNPVWYSGSIHLGSVKVKLDQRVTKDTVIGTVGAACATNDHLHFVVYKGRNTNGGLVSFNVNIVERVPQPPSPSPITGSLVWNFNSTGYAEGWTVTNASAYAVRNGVLFVDPAGDDPYISSPRLNLSASLFKWVVINMASNGLDNNGSIYFKTDWDDRYTSTKRMDFQVKEWTTSGNARFATNVVYAGFHPSWRGRITGIRIDPTGRGRAGTNRDTIGFDSIKITSNP